MDSFKEIKLAYLKKCAREKHPFYKVLQCTSDQGWIIRGIYETRTCAELETRSTKRKTRIQEIQLNQLPLEHWKKISCIFQDNDFLHSVPLHWNAVALQKRQN